MAGELASKMAGSVLKAAVNRLGEQEVDGLLTRAGRTGGLNIKYERGQVAFEGKGDAGLALAAVFDGVFEMLKDSQGPRAARSIMVDATEPLAQSDPVMLVSSGVMGLLPAPVRIRLELSALRKVKGIEEPAPAAPASEEP